jgi:hypothetical protein
VDKLKICCIHILSTGVAPYSHQLSFAVIYYDSYKVIASPPGLAYVIVKEPGISGLLLFFLYYDVRKRELM